MNDKIKYYQLGEVMPFGKYKGVSIEVMIETDPKYVQWLLDNVDNFYLSDGSKKRLQERFREDKTVTQILNSR